MLLFRVSLSLECLLEERLLIFFRREEGDEPVDPIKNQLPFRENSDKFPFSEHFVHCKSRLSIQAQNGNESDNLSSKALPKVQEAAI